MTTSNGKAGHEPCEAPKEKVPLSSYIVYAGMIISNPIRKVWCKLAAKLGRGGETAGPTLATAALTSPILYTAFHVIEPISTIAEVITGVALSVALGLGMGMATAALADEMDTPTLDDELCKERRRIREKRQVRQKGVQTLLEKGGRSR